ncbi:hypothetical protein FYJ33_15100 [Clostridiaceae bacterium WCA-383-APC-5B]|uniref:Uncharacterized protein n=2 Tax=Inconstantimicrobium porci TaxID=2652291 RepID=A0A7X2T2H8_9CLOT|nr:hypothetical protein [Inconstantimicrobium porci]
MRLIVYIEDVIRNEEDKVKIPVFGVVKDIELIKTLDDNMLEQFKNEPYSISFSETDIVGTTEVFNHNDANFVAYYKRHRKTLDELNYENLKEFINDNEIKFDEILDIKIISYVDGVSRKTDTIKQLIDYTNESEKCILSKGEWYKYNDDYLNYLQESISEIEVVNYDKYDLSIRKFKEYQERKYEEDKYKEKYKGKSEKEIRKSISNIYYKEKYYNSMLEEEFGFENLDREFEFVGKSKIEVMDLYKDDTMFAVKIGKTSGKLCYVVDQSLEALKVYKHNILDNKPEIKNVAIWIVLQKAKKLKEINGKPDINELDMLILKNKLDGWKKEVRVLGFKPIIYINYEVE